MSEEVLHVDLGRDALAFGSAQCFDQREVTSSSAAHCEAE